MGQVEYWRCPICGEKLGVDNTPIPYGKMGCKEYTSCNRQAHVTGQYYKNINGQVKEGESVGIAEIANNSDGM